MNTQIIEQILNMTNEYCKICEEMRTFTRKVMQKYESISHRMKIELAISNDNNEVHLQSVKVYKDMKLIMSYISKGTNCSFEEIDASALVI